MGVAIENLPFVAQRTDWTPSPGDPRFPRSFWTAKPSGDYRQDVFTGAEMAKLAIEFIRSERSPYILGWIVRDMIEVGDWSGNGLIVGFMQEVSKDLIGRTH